MGCMVAVPAVDITPPSPPLPTQVNKVAGRAYQLGNMHAYDTIPSFPSTG